MLKIVFIASAILCVIVLFLKFSWAKWIFLIGSACCAFSLIVLNLNNFGYALDPEKIGPIKKFNRKKESNNMKHAQTIIGKRVRVIIGNEMPVEDDENTIVGQDTNLAVSPEELQGKTIIGEKIEMHIGDVKKKDTDR